MAVWHWLAERHPRAFRHLYRLAPGPLRPWRLERPPTSQAVVHLDSGLTIEGGLGPWLASRGLNWSVECDTAGDVRRWQLVDRESGAVKDVVEGDDKAEVIAMFERSAGPGSRRFLH